MINDPRTGHPAQVDTNVDSIWGESFTQTLEGLLCHQRALQECLLVEVCVIGHMSKRGNHEVAVTIWVEVHHHVGVASPKENVVSGVIPRHSHLT